MRIEARCCSVMGAFGALAIGVQPGCEEVARARSDSPNPAAAVAQGLTCLSAQTIISPSPSLNGMFGGYGLAMEGDTAVIGGMRDAYVYRVSGGAWELEAPLPARPDTSVSNEVAISGDTVAVAGTCSSAPDFRSLPCADIYRRTGSTWAFEDRVLITAEEKMPNLGDNGVSIELSSDTLLLGSTRHEAVFTFERSGGTWTERQVITVPADADAGLRGLLGRSMALEGDTAILADTAGSSTTFPGGAYAFVRTGGSWTLQQRLEPSGSPGSWFGTGIGLSGDTAVVTDAHPFGPAIHVFRRTGTVWAEEEKISGYDVLFPIAIDGDTLVVGLGLPLQTVVFERNGTDWTPSLVIPRVGPWLALENGWLLIGQPAHAVGGRASVGAVYAYRLSPDDAGTTACPGAEAGADASTEASTPETGPSIRDADIDSSEPAEAAPDVTTTPVDAARDVEASATEGGSDSSTHPVDGPSMGGAAGSGGQASTGGTSASGGTGQALDTGGRPSVGGAGLGGSRTVPPDASSDAEVDLRAQGHAAGGCNCRMTGPRTGGDFLFAALVAWSAFTRRRRPSR